jgi:hypothetical protein
LARIGQSRRTFVHRCTVLSSAIEARNSRTATAITVHRIADASRCGSISASAIPKKFTFCLAPRDESSLR